MNVRVGRRAGMRLVAVSPFAVVLVLSLLAALAPSSPGVSPASAGLEPVPAPPVLTLAPGAATGDLAVVAARPQGELEGNAHPTITFNKPIVAISDAEGAAAKTPPVSMTPRVPGEWRWLGSATIEFVPARPLPLASEFSVRVEKGIKALDGSVLKEPYTFQFTTLAPQIVDVKPERGWKWVAPDASFVLTFNQPVRIDGHVTLAAGEGKAARAIPLTLVKTEERLDTRKPAGEGEGEGEDEGESRWQRGGGSDDDHRLEISRYTFKPASALPLDADLNLQVDAKVVAVEGTRTLGPESIVFRTYGPPKIASVTTWGSRGPIVFVTSNVLDPTTIKDQLTVTPPVEIAWDAVNAFQGWDGPQLVVPGKFMPGTKYHFAFKAGYRDVYGQAGTPWTGSFDLPDLAASIQVDNQAVLIEAGGDGALPVRLVNVPNATAHVWTLTAAELARLSANRWRGWDLSPDRARAAVLPGPPRRNAYRWAPLDLRSFLPAGQRSGYFAVRLAAPGVAEDNRRQVLVQVSPFAVHAKLGAASGAVWVTELASAAPVAGASVSVLDETGTEIARGDTGADGVAHLPALSGKGGSTGGGRRPLTVAVQKGDDVGASIAEWGEDVWAGSFQEWQPFDPAPVPLGFAAAERGVYRPGDEVWLKGLLRYRTPNSGEILAPAAGETVSITVTGPRQEKVLERDVKTTAFGTVAASFTLPKDGSLGTHSIAATFKVGEAKISVAGSFRVEEYRAPQFLVDVAAPSPSVISGDPLRADATARYLFGGALASADVRWSATRQSIEYDPPGHDGFTFGTHTWGWDDRSPRGYSDQAGSGEGKTDTAGRFAIDAGRAETPGGRTFRYTLEAEVTDVSRHRLADRVEITVHPAAVYAGLKVNGDGFAVAGHAIDVDLVAASPDGALVAGRPVTLDVRQRTWKSIRKRGPDGDWFMVEEPVEEPLTSCSVTSATTAQRCTFKAPKPGLYVLEAKVRDDRDRTGTTKTMIYVVGPGWVSWSGADDSLELVPDKPLYGIGDTAHVLVKSPFPECEALVTIEREGVVSARRVHMTGAANTVDVPIDASMVPNVFVSVVLTRGRIANAAAVNEDDADPGRPAARIGYAALKVENRSKRLAVDVTVDAPEKRPRQKVTVDVQVRNWKGAGTPAEITLWAVDEGVLRLTAYQPPDPVAAIHPERPLLVRTLESLKSLLVRRKFTDEKGGEPQASLKSVAPGEMAEMALRWGGGGGDAAGSGIRTNFKTTVFFAPDLVTDEKGHATLTVELPDNLTTFRIMALAVTKDDRMGGGGSKVTVTKPLIALPALPRLARVGDRFEAGVVVHAKDGRERDVTVRAEAQGVTLRGEATKTVHVTGTAPREVRFPFTAEAPGTARLRFFVAGGGEQDAVEQLVPVRLPARLETVAVYGDTKDRVVEGIAPPKGARADIGGLEVTLASSALGGYGNVVRQVVEYPYGCVEQLSSRLVPLVAQRRIQRVFGVQPNALTDEQRKEADRREGIFADWLGATSGIAGKDTPDEVAQKAIDAIQKLQNDDGSFRYWPDSNCISIDGSIYAVLALARARGVGYTVNPDAVARGQKFLGDHIAAGHTVSCGWLQFAPTPSERMFALWVLARTGSPLASYYGEMYTLRDRLPLYARAMLADALIKSGDRDRGQKLLVDVLNSARETAGEVHFQEVASAVNTEEWSSDTRTTAIVLMVLAGDLPDHPYVGKIARWLAATRNGAGEFRNTQEAGFALLAIEQLITTKEKDTPDFTAKVALGGSTVAEGTFRGRSLEVQRGALPLAKIAGQSGQAPLTFEKQGTGVLYYTASLRYAPLRYDLAPLDRGMIVQRWFEPWGGGGQSTSFAAGDLVRVRVRVATPSERRFVAIEVPIPAGLELVDTSLATTARPPVSVGSATEPGEENDEEADPDAGWRRWQYVFYSPFNHRELRDDRMLLFADDLPAGVTETSFVARAITPGEFLLYPAYAGEMYTPEVFGRSGGGTFRVLSDGGRK